MPRHQSLGHHARPQDLALQSRGELGEIQVPDRHGRDRLEVRHDGHDPFLPLARLLLVAVLDFLGLVHHDAVDVPRDARAPGLQAVDQLLRRVAL